MSSVTNDSELDELERLRARVAALEAELLEVQRWANVEVGKAQAKAYWLERWHLDLNEVMRDPRADKVRAVVRAVRSVYRRLLRLKQRLLT